MDNQGIVLNWLKRNRADKVPVKTMEDAMKIYISITGAKTGYKSRLEHRAEFEQIKQDLREAGIDPANKTYTRCSQEHQSFYANGIIGLHKDEIFGKEK